jgi:hypothetical protein
VSTASRRPSLIVALAAIVGACVNSPTRAAEGDGATDAAQPIVAMDVGDATELPGGPDTDPAPCDLTGLWLEGRPPHLNAAVGCQQPIVIVAHGERFEVWTRGQRWRGSLFQNEVSINTSVPSEPHRGTR